MREKLWKEIFNHPDDFQADMYAKVTAAKLLVMKAACEKDGMDIAHSGAMAKLYVSKLH
jgi:alkylation response protein AidB-like acyl-CoA dehydrogenase